MNLTDGLDGLAAGTAAIAFIAMSIAVLPIYPGMPAGWNIVDRNQFCARRCVSHG